MFSRWTPPAFRFCFYCFCLWSFQVGINSHPAPCDGRSVLLQLSCPGALLFDQGVGVKEGAGHHKLRGSVSSGGRRAGTKMSAGWHHQDGVQGNSLDVPLWSCEYIQLMLENYCMLFFFFSFSFFFFLKFHITHMISGALQENNVAAFVLSRSPSFLQLLGRTALFCRNAAEMFCTKLHPTFKAAWVWIDTASFFSELIP